MFFIISFTPDFFSMWYFLSTKSDCCFRRIIISDLDFWVSRIQSNGLFTVLTRYLQQTSVLNYHFLAPLYMQPLTFQKLNYILVSSYLTGLIFNHIINFPSYWDHACILCWHSQLQKFCFLENCVPIYWQSECPIWTDFYLSITWRTLALCVPACWQSQCLAWTNSYLLLIEV